MVAALPADTGIKELRYVSLVGTLSNEPADYREWWRDERHAEKAGFRAIAAKFHEELKK